MEEILVEIPLLVFTLIEDMCVGAMVFAIIWYLIDDVDAKIYSKTTLAIGIIAAVGMGVAMLHLGQPLRAINALRGLGTSWLSREVLFYGLFVVAILIHAYMSRKGKTKASKNVGIAAAALGIITLFCTVMCYIMPGVILWNTVLTPLRFLAAAFALGWVLKTSLKNTFEKSNIVKTWWIAFAVVLILFIVERSFFFYASGLLIDNVPFLTL